MKELGLQGDEGTKGLSDKETFERENLRNSAFFICETLREIFNVICIKGDRRCMQELTGKEPRIACRIPRTVFLTNSNTRTLTTLLVSF